MRETFTPSDKSVKGAREVCASVGCSHSKVCLSSGRHLFPPFPLLSFKASSSGTSLLCSNQHQQSQRASNVPSHRLFFLPATCLNKTKEESVNYSIDFLLIQVLHCCLFLLSISSFFSLSQRQSSPLMLCFDCLMGFLVSISL